MNLHEFKVWFCSGRDFACFVLRPDGELRWKSDFKNDECVLMVGDRMNPICHPEKTRPYEWRVRCDETSVLVFRHIGKDAILYNARPLDTSVCLTLRNVPGIDFDVSKFNALVDIGVGFVEAVLLASFDEVCDRFTKWEETMADITREIMGRV